MLRVAASDAASGSQRVEIAREIKKINLAVTSCRHGGTTLGSYESIEEAEAVYKHAKETGMPFTGYEKRYTNPVRTERGTGTPPTGRDDKAAAGNQRSRRWEMRPKKAQLPLPLYHLPRMVVTLVT